MEKLKREFEEKKAEVERVKGTLQSNEKVCGDDAVNTE